MGNKYPHTHWEQSLFSDLAGIDVTDELGNALRRVCPLLQQDNRCGLQGDKWFTVKCHRKKLRKLRKLKRQFLNIIKHNNVQIRCTHDFRAIVCFIIRMAELCSFLTVHFLIPFKIQFKTRLGMEKHQKLKYTWHSKVCFMSTCHWYLSFSSYTLLNFSIFIN